MADGIYVSMTGAVARSRQLDALADDLANAQTPGFKASRPVFATVLAEAGSQRAYAVAQDHGVDTRPGAIAQTGNPLDLLPEGGAWFSVLTPGGEPAYTRDGRVTISPEGVLTVGGQPLLSEAGREISVPRDAKLLIDSNGAVKVDEVEIARLGLFLLEGPAARVGTSLIAPAAGGSARPVQGRVQGGAVELGNHTPLQAVVEMVTTQRGFEASMQAIETYKRIGERSSELGRVR